MCSEKFVATLETQKVHFQSITDGVDTKTPAGRFFKFRRFLPERW
jgi:DNA invertase Pin-like site-specific DNA recombinase